MKYRKGMILSMLVIFLFCIAGACASDVNDTQAASMDDSGIELTATDNDFKAIDYDNVTTDGETLSAGNDGPADVQNDLDKLGANPGTYSQLSGEIGSGGNVELQHDYYSYDSGSTIVVTQANSVINGRGAVIDMAGSSIRALHVSATGVTIKNLTIKNVNAQEYGGAIYFSGEGSGTVENCNFTANKVSGQDKHGTIYFNNRWGSVRNCNFDNNKATSGGGVYFGLLASGEVENCNFTNNSATEYLDDYDGGGGVYFMGDGTIKNCNFINNTASIYGGAVYFLYDDVGTIENCNFENNRAPNGGAAFFFRGCDVKNSNFTGNSANDGGAMYMYRQTEYGTNTITNCNFNNNKATESAGCLYIRVSGTVDGCNFTNNSAYYQGGIYFSNDGTVKNCNFDNNKATDSTGGAFYIANSGTVTNSNFTNNKAATWGGAIFFNKGGAVENCNFINNTASNGGGAILFTEKSSVTGCNFTGNLVSQRGEGGAIRISSGTIRNSRFTNNKVSISSAGAVWISTGSVENCSFTNNSAPSNDGGALRMNSGTVLNCNFTDNTAASYGGAVYIRESGNVTNCNFTNNRAISKDGGALRINLGRIENCSFSNNSVNGENAKGGSVWLNGTNGVVYGCSFVDNSANGYGSRAGAIYWNGNDGNLSDCSFVNNSATFFGGAVYWMGNDAVVFNCSFVNNSNLREAAAIYWDSASNVNISYCIFIDNRADNAVIQFFNSYGRENLTVNDNIFLNNDCVAVIFGSIDDTFNTDYNWFGQNAGNYMVNPDVQGCNIWLFLDATAVPDLIPLSDKFNVTFKLSAYDSVRVCEYNNSRVWQINLTLTPTIGKVNETIVNLNRTVSYTADTAGEGRLTESIENTEYSVPLNVTDGTSFFDLNWIINGNDNDTIVLDRDYTYNSTIGSDFAYGIIISRPVTIIGNGHIINAAGKTRIFNIQAENVSISNITFINAKRRGEAGAITWDGDNGKLLDCIFVNNTSNAGGAISWSRANGVVSGCVFVNNTVPDYGGAILWFAENGKVLDCIFENNSAGNSGGAIWWRSVSRGLAYDCVFVNNTANDGGAIFCDGQNGNVIGCAFVNNTANNGIIRFGNQRDESRNLTINDNIFLNNNAVPISFYRSDSESNTDYNWFGHNATNYMDDPNLESCNIWLFLNATQSSEFVALSSEFDVAFRLYAYDSFEVFEYDNSRLKEINLTVTPTIGKVNSSRTALDKPVRYTAESVGTGKLTATIENTEYSISLTIMDGTSFTDLNWAINGNDNDTIVLDRDYTYNSTADSNFADGIVISRPVTIIANGHRINGANQARIFNIQADDVTISNITFIYAKATGNGGAIMWNGDRGTASDCVFVNNTVIEFNCRGGAIWWNGVDGAVSGCVFENNSADGYGSGGGAINWYGANGRISDSRFVNNSVTFFGGAIYWIGDDGVVSGCSFVDNTNFRDGGAIYWDGKDGNISRSIFVNNSAENGVIHFFNSLSGRDLSVNDNIFLNNDAAPFSVDAHDSLYNTDYNWYGQNATNYMDNPNVEGCSIWLFLDTTAVPDMMSVSDTFDIMFKLYAYDSNEVSEYDNGRLNDVTLALTSTSGKLNATRTYLDKPLHYTPESPGTGMIKATMENAEYTVTFTVTDGTSFWDLNRVINGNDNDTIVLDRDYTYNSTIDSAFANGILISRMLTIDGNGHSISGANQARIFNVGANDATVKNLTLKNANVIGGSGGAIFFSVSGTVEGCSFVNDTASSYGGAVCLSEGNVINCNFTDNAVTDGNGGAIWINSGTVENCNFANNTAGEWGGAVMIADVGNVTNCSFTDNRADVQGGAVWMLSGNIENANFTDNRAVLLGGAIHMLSGSIADCSFMNNQATGGVGCGGAVYFAGGSGGDVANCNFTNNSANNGGAVYFNCNGRLTNCSFIDNEANVGGAVLWNCADGVASSCIFINNSADNGIIYFDNAGSGAHLIINDNIFLRNEGKAISFAESDGASNADFNWFGNTKDDFNEKPLSDNVDIGIWLFLDAKSNPDIFPISTASEITFSLYAYDSNEVFGYDNSRLKPVKLTITPVNGQVNATNVEPAKTILYTESGAGSDNLTASIENVSWTVTLKIADGTTFWDLNNAINASSSDTVTLDRNYAYNPITDYDFKDGIIINRMVTIIGGDYSIDAKGQARIFNIHADKVTIRNVTFINANATDYGGALYWNGVNVTVFDCLFVNNSAGISGGAIYWRDGADTNVSGCVFVNNTAENGGAVTVGDGVVSGCSFVNNTAEYGGAVILAGGTLSGCSFVNNTAEYGGAVILAGGTLSGCSFVNNSAYNCGAVSLVDGTVSGCSFVNNTADNDGGAIAWSTTEWSSNRGYVFDCSFENNRAGSDGGAIFWLNGANGVVSDCIFVNNSASDEGGAILWSHNDNANISGCSFANNTAGSDGGAIYLKFSANGVVYDCIFVNNSARYGGAIEWQQSDNGNISTCIFVNNSDERAVIFFYNMGSGHGLSINNNIFLNNSADAISFVLPDSSSNADYNWFGNNATDYETQPATSNVAISNWLFLNATATPDSILIFQSSDIIFRLHSYSESEGVSDYDNSKLPEVNLTLKATKGNLVGIAKLDELIRYFAMDYGTGTVTGKIENAQYTVEIINEKADLNLSVETSQVTYSHNTLISLSYDPNATGKVNITLKSKRFEYTFVDVDLNATLSLGDIAADEYEIIIRYSGDSLFTNSTAAADLKVDKANSTLTANNVTLDYGTGTTVTVTTDGTLSITAIINGEETFVKGNIILIPAMDAGTYNLTVTAIPDENHNAVTKTVTITVNRLKTQIVANAVTATYNVNKYLTITLKDAKGKALGGVKVTVNLNGAKTYTTDKNGQIKISTKGLAPKTYTAKIAFSGNKNYLKSSKNAKITVKKAKAKLTAKSKKFKRSKKVKKYTVVLKSNVGKPLKKVKLTIKIKGKKYKKTFKAKTNKKGKATFKIKKLTRKGKYRAVITYKGNKYYTKMTKKVKITVK